MARVSDLYDITYKTSVPHFLGFLSEEEEEISNRFLNSQKIKHIFFGGYDDAQRKILCCLPDWCEKPEFPIDAVTFSYNSSYKLSHRDFLGALMSIGITRESVGDILVEDGRTVVFFKNTITDFVLTQIDKVGKVGVNVKIGFENPLPSVGELVNCTNTVSSLRLDCVVGAVCNVSRNMATSLIEESRVCVNSFVTEKPTKLINSGDTLTIKGKGKFFIASAFEHTKKGRIILNYNKYK